MSLPFRISSGDYIKKNFLWIQVWFNFIWLKRTRFWKWIKIWWRQKFKPVEKINSKTIVIKPEFIDFYLKNFWIWKT